MAQLLTSALSPAAVVGTQLRLLPASRFGKDQASRPFSRLIPG